MSTLVVVKMLLASIILTGCTQVFDAQYDYVEPEFIQIETKNDGSGTPLQEFLYVNPNQELNLFAVYRDPDFGPLKNVLVDWSLSSGVGQISNKKDISTKFLSTQTGTSNLEVKYKDKVLKNITIKVVPTLSISTNTLTLDEGSTKTLTFSLSEPYQEDVIVFLKNTDLTASQGIDYQDNIPSSVTINAGDTSADITITANNDSYYEHFLESFNIEVTELENAIASDKETQIFINNLDPKPPLSINSVTVQEDVGEANLTVSLSYPSTETVSFDYITSDVSALNAQDYSFISSSGTILPGQTELVIDIPIIDNLLNETTEVFDVTLSNSINTSAVTTATGAITLLDNDSLPELSWSSNALTVNEGDSASFTFNLNQPYAADVTFNLSTSNNTAISGSDYTAVSNQLITIPSGQTSVSAVINTLTDTTYEPNTETVDLSITNIVNATNTQNTGLLTINNIDTKPTLSTADLTVDESVGTASVQVNLSGPSAETVTVDYSSSNNTAVAPEDYTATSGTLSFSPGQTSLNIPITIIDDSLDEVNQTLSLTLSNPVNVDTITTSVSNITITDNDEAPTLNWSSTSIIESEGTPASVTFSLSKVDDEDTTFTLSSSDNTATAGEDYTAITAESLTIPAGQLSVSTSVNLIADGLYQGSSELINLSITTPSNATPASTTGTVQINDTDNQPTISISDESLTESDSNMTFTVTLSHESIETITIDYATSNNTATSGTDYTNTSGTLSFAPKEITKTISVPIISDEFVEGDETFNVTLSNPTNISSINKATGVGTIVDNDTYPSLSWSQTSLSVNEGDQASITFTLSKTYVEDVSFDVSTNNGTAQAGSDYTAVSSQTFTIPSGQSSVTVNIATLTDSNYDNGTEDFSVLLTNPTNVTSSVLNGTVNIVDLDNQPNISIADVTLNESGGSAEFVLTLSHRSEQSVTVDYQTNDGTATAGADYTSSSGSISILAGQLTNTLTITVNNDELVESAETFTVSLNNAVNASSITDGTAIATITDNDSYPTLSWSSTNMTVFEGNAANITFNLSKTYPEDITFNVSTTNGTAVAGEDYVGKASELITITGGQTSSSISINTLSDSTYEGATQSFTVNISALTNVTTSTTSGSVNITDLDSPPTISISSASTVAEEDGVTSFTLSLSHKTVQTVGVNYTTSNGSAVSGSDYTLKSGSVNFSPGEITKNITVNILDDEIPEPTESFSMTISGATNISSISDNTGVATITDSDTYPDLAWSTTSLSLTEGTSNTITFTLSETYAQDVSFDVSTSNNTALAGSDYTAISTVSKIIPAGSTSVDVTFNALNDNIYEANNESYDIILNNFVNVSPSTTTGSVIITNTNTMPSATITTTNQTVDESVGQITVKVELNKQSTQTISVDYTSTDISTSSGSDYVSNSGTLVFSPGQTSKNIFYTINDDSDTESNESFSVNISNGQNINSIINSSVSFTITDNDLSFGTDGVIHFGATTMSDSPASTDYFRNGVEDNDGNLYLVGQTTGSFIETNSASKSDVLIVKLTKTGQVDTSFGTNGWVQFGNESFGTGSNGADVPIAVKLFNNKLIIAGTSDGNLGGINQSPGSNDIFVARVDTNGNIDTSFSGNGVFLFGSSAADYIYSMDIDTSGNIYVAGNTEGNIDDTLNGTSDGYIGKIVPGGFFDLSFSSNGRIQFGTSASFNTSKREIIKAIRVDSSGRIYLAGITQSPMEETIAVDNTYDIFSIRLNSSGLLDSSFNGNGIIQLGETTVGPGAGNDDDARDLVIDTDNNLYITGTARGAFGASYAGDTDIVVIKINSSGYVDTTFADSGYLQIGSSSGDLAQAITIDANDKINIAGSSTGALEELSAGSSDFVLIRIDKSGNLDTTFDDNGVFHFGRTTETERSAEAGGIQQTYGVIAGNSGYVYLVGYTFNGFLESSNGFVDPVILRFGTNTLQ